MRERIRAPSSFFINTSPNLTRPSPNLTRPLSNLTRPSSTTYAPLAKSYAAFAATKAAFVGHHPNLCPNLRAPRSQKRLQNNNSDPSLNMKGAPSWRISPPSVELKPPLL